MNATPRSSSGLDRELRYLELLEMLDRYARPGAVLELGSGPDGLQSRGYPGAVSVDLRPLDAISVQANGVALPFKPNAFGTAVCVDVLEHIPREVRAGVVKELRRVASDLLIVGGPMGPDAEDADRRLAGWFDLMNRAQPDWLQEHIETAPYPTPAELDRIAESQPLASSPGVSLGSHQLLTAAQNLPGGWRLGQQLARSIQKRPGLRRAATYRHNPYRALIAYDLRPVKFSVIMATRNRADRLPAAVASVLAQAEGDFELLIVNDASTDETSYVIEELTATDSRIRPITRPAASGSCGLARNTALPKARGEYVAFCDDDVSWRPDHLAACRDALATTTACYTQAARHLPDGRFYDIAGHARPSGEPQVGDVDANTIAIRRSVMQPFPDGRGRYESEDIALVRKLWASGVRATLVPRVTVDYTFNLKSMCYRYSIAEESSGPRISARPLVRDAKGLAGRVREAVAYRRRHRLPARG